MDGKKDAKRSRPARSEPARTKPARGVGTGAKNNGENSAVIKEAERVMNGVPIMKLLSAEITRLDEGVCELTAPKKENYDGIFETFHGGLITTVADTAAAAAVLTVAGADASITTTDIHIRFLRPCRSAVTATATVIKAGRTLCPVDVSLADEDGRQVATAQVTYMVMRS